MKTTLNRIKQLNCLPFESFEKLLRCVGVTAPNDAPLPMIRVLDALGFEEALRCLAAVDGFEREIRLFAVGCVAHVADQLKDPRSRRMLEVAERYAKGKATGLELNTAWDDASHSSDGRAGTAVWACGFYGIKTALTIVISSVLDALHDADKEDHSAMRAAMYIKADLEELLALEVEHHKIGIIPRP